MLSEGESAQKMQLEHYGCWRKEVYEQNIYVHCVLFVDHEEV